MEHLKSLAWNFLHFNLEALCARKPFHPRQTRMVVSLIGAKGGGNVMKQWVVYTGRLLFRENGKNT